MAGWLGLSRHLARLTLTVLNGYAMAVNLLRSGKRRRLCDVAPGWFRIHRSLSAPEATKTIAMFPSILVTLALACLSATHIAALPVPHLNSGVLPSVTGYGAVRRSTSQLHIVAADDEANKLDMRDPRNWVASADSLITTTVPAAAHSKRSQGAAIAAADDDEDESIFASLVAQDASYLAIHRAQMPVRDLTSTTGDSLEPNGVHASLSAAMAIRQIEQRQAEADVKKREQQATVVPASEYGRMDRRRGQA